MDWIELIKLKLTKDDTYSLRNSRMQKWQVDLAGRLEAKFDAAIQAAQKAGHFAQLYSRRDDNMRSVELFFGAHPVGISLKDKSTAIEGGAALVFSQAVNGSVGVFLYPYKSERMRRTETHITWKIFGGPEDVTDRQIDAAIADFWRYSRVSSCLDGGSWFDQFLIRKLVKKSQTFNPPQDGQPEVKAGGWFQRLVSSQLAQLIGLLSALATLAGVTVPQLWTHWHQPDPAVAAKLSVPTSPRSHHATAEKARPQVRPAMSVIEGHYTLCPNSAPSSDSTRWLNFLYDVDANAGKTVFLRVSVHVECLVGKSDLERSLGRKVEEGKIEYSFRELPLFAKSQQKYIAGLLDGPRDIKRLTAIIPDNGAYISVRGDQEGRNAYSRLQINAEGLDDVIYGPFLIKKGGEDGFVTFELSPPILDNVTEDAVSRIANERPTLHAKR